MSKNKPYGKRISVWFIFRFIIHHTIKSVAVSHMEIALLSNETYNFIVLIYHDILIHQYSIRFNLI